MKKLPLVIVLVLTTSSMLMGCLSEDSKGYAEGMIEVLFPKGTNLTEANHTISKYNCTIIKILDMGYGIHEGHYTYRVEVPRGEENRYIELFNSEPIVMKAKRVQWK